MIGAVALAAGDWACEAGSAMTHVARIAPTRYHIVRLMLRRITMVGSAVVLACASPGAAHAQDSTRAELSRWIFPGSEEESYLRYLQTLGVVREYPWSVRAFSSDELRLLAPKSDDHPWANARGLRGRRLLYRGVRLEVAPATIDTWYTTAFPYGWNAGAVWVGRGLTGPVRGG